MDHQTAFNHLCFFLNKQSSPEELRALINTFSDADWGRLLQIAQNQNVTLIFYDKLTHQHIKDHVPKPILDELHESYLVATARNLRMLRHASLILKQLRSHTIDVIPLKGIYLIDIIYTKVGVRRLSDIDLLIHKADSSRALAAMQELGYALTTYYDPQNSNLDIKHIPPMIKENGPMAELHWSILEEDEPFPIDMAGIWERAQPASVTGVEVLKLSLEDLVLHLCIHFTYQHRLRGGLTALYDIAQIMEKFKGQIDWSKLISIAESWDAERVVYLTLSLLALKLGADIPQAISGAMQTDPIDPIIADMAERQLLYRNYLKPSLTPDLVSLSDTQGWLAKLNIIRKRIFLPRRTIARIYNVSPNSLQIYRYYAVRFRELFKRYSRPMHKINKNSRGLDDTYLFEQENRNLRKWMVH